MTKFYFSATHRFDEDHVSFICSFSRTLKSKEWVVVDMGYPYGITTAQIDKPMDELKALSTRDSILEVICAPKEIMGYEEVKKSKIQAQELLNMMEERNRIVALLEKCKKNATLDPEYGELWAAYQKLMSAGHNDQPDGSFDI